MPDNHTAPTQYIPCANCGAPLGRKPFFFTMRKTNRRDGAPLAKITGVVWAADEEQAGEAAWQKHGTETTCQLTVEEINPEEGFSFTVYRSEI